MIVVLPFVVLKFAFTNQCLARCAKLLLYCVSVFLLNEERQKTKPVYIRRCAGCAFLLEVADKEGRTPTFYAAQHGQVAALEYIISNAPSGARVLQVADNYDVMPVHVAMTLRTASVAIKVLSHIEAAAGPSMLVDSRDALGRTPAAYYTTAAALEFIADHAPTRAKALEDIIDLETGGTLAHLAAAKNDLLTIEFLLQRCPSGAKILEVCDVLGRTPMHVAMERSFLALLQHMVQRAPHGAACLRQLPPTTTEAEDTMNVIQISPRRRRALAAFSVCLAAPVDVELSFDDSFYANNSRKPRPSPCSSQMAMLEYLKKILVMADDDLASVANCNTRTNQV